MSARYSLRGAVAKHRVRAVFDILEDLGDTDSAFIARAIVDALPADKRAAVVAELTAPATPAG